jgi:hypothetical protein
MVNADLPIHSVADIARIVKEKPGSLKFASNAPGLWCISRVRR